MLGQVKKLSAADGRRELAARFGAWWDGRDFTPPAAAEGGEAAAADLQTQAAAPAPTTPLTAAAGAATVRVRALTTLWGEGRLSPGSPELDTLLLDRLFEGADQSGDVGFIGADAAIINACLARSDRTVRAVDWRTGCAAALKPYAPTVDIIQSDLDRPKGLTDGGIEALCTIEAFAYADHKPGLVARAFRSLSPTGRWVFLDTTRTTAKTPPSAFASAWAEPQLSVNEEVEQILQAAGFRSVRREPVTALVLDAARKGYARLSRSLDASVTTGLSGREGALFLQELAWEAQSWRARIRALEGGALEVNVWIADKIEREAGPVAEPLAGAFDEPTAAEEAPVSGEPLGQNDIDSLFD